MIKKIIIGIALLIGALLVLIITVGITNPTSLSKPEPAATKITDPVLSVDLKGILKNELKDITFYLVDTTDNNINIEFLCSDGTSDMMRYDAQEDIFNILAIVHRTVYKDKSITIECKANVVDGYGNEKVANVLLLNYSVETLKQINYNSGTVYLHMFELADSAPKFIHSNIF